MQTVLIPQKNLRVPKRMAMIVSVGLSVFLRSLKLVYLQIGYRYTYTAKSVNNISSDCLQCFVACANAFTYEANSGMNLCIKRDHVRLLNFTLWDFG